MSTYYDYLINPFGGSILKLRQWNWEAVEDTSPYVFRLCRSSIVAGDPTVMLDLLRRISPSYRLTFGFDSNAAWLSLSNDTTPLAEAIMLTAKDKRMIAAFSTLSQPFRILGLAPSLDWTEQIVDYPCVATIVFGGWTPEDLRLQLFSGDLIKTWSAAYFSLAGSTAAAKQPYDPIEGSGDILLGIARDLRKDRR